MKQFLLSLFGETSDISMVRVMAFICCLSACHLALSKGPEELGVITALLSCAFAGKVIQKAVEVRKADSDG